MRVKDPLLYRFRVDALREAGGIDNVAMMLCADDGVISSERGKPRTTPRVPRLP